MPMDISAALLKLFAPVVRAFSPKAKQIHKERVAAANPESVVDLTEIILDDALQRLGVRDPNHAWWEQALVSLCGQAVRTDFLKLPHVQQWINLPDTQRQLKNVARANLGGGTPSEESIGALIDSYMVISLENPQYAVSAIQNVIAVLRASVQGSVQDPGVGALIQNLALEQRKCFLELIEQLGGSVHHGQSIAALESDEAILERWRVELRRTSRDLLDWPTSLGSGQWIKRPELFEITNIINDSEFSTTAILGPPGAGKSALLAVLGRQLQDEQNLTVFAIKADLLDVSVLNEADLQRCLDLPEAPSVMLQRLCEHGPVVLIIDQLDALASYLDMKTGRLSTLINLVRRVGQTKNIHTVLSSRIFEFNHDVRLRTIETQSIELQAPSWSDVLVILEANGVNAAGWPGDAQEVMRNPQALNTYLSLNRGSESEPFDTYQGMLDRLWDQRVLSGGGGPVQARLAYQIANTMAEEETLWLASTRFDEHAAAVNVLTAAGILKESSEGSLGFSHQTLFDYALARHFSQGKGRLSSYILDRQGSLFVRAKLWAALTYLRSREMTAYVSEFEAIWSASGLRKHLRYLLIDFLGQQVAPTDQEALLLEKALCNPDEQALVLKAITGSPGWFLRFADGYIAEAMTKNEMTAKLTVPILITAFKDSPEIVTRLVVAHWTSDASNDRRIWSVLQSAPLWTETFLAIAKDVVIRSDFSGLFVDPVIATLGVSQPQMAMALLRTVLDHQLGCAIEQAALANALPKPKFDTLQQELEWRIDSKPTRAIEELLTDSQWDSLSALADSVPEAFLDGLWPWFLKLYESLDAYTSAAPPAYGFRLPYASDFRFVGENGNSEPPVLLEALVIAVEKTAKTNPAKFRGWVAIEEANSLAPIQRLIAHGLTFDAPNTSSEALEFLLADTRRLNLGSHRDLRSTTKALVGACAPYWSDAEVAQFESLVLAYTPAAPSHLTEPSQRRTWSLQVRRMKVDLLRALPTRRRSSPIQRRVLEESRVFPERQIDKGVTFVSMDSIMSAEAIGLATDADVLNAFKALPDSTNWDHPKNWELGGNIQLATAFSEFAKTEPLRAKQLILQFSPEIGERAASYSLRPLVESTCPEIVCDVISELSKRGFKSQEFQSSVAGAIDRLIERSISISDQAVQTLESWFELILDAPSIHKNISGLDKNTDSDSGSHEHDLNDDDSIQESASEGEIVTSLFWDAHKIFTIPDGDYSIVSALIQARLARREDHRVVEILESYLQRSKDVRTWEHLLYFVPYMRGLVSDRARVVQSILDGIPQLVGKATTGQLLISAQWYAPELVEAHLSKWKSGHSKATEQGYGELTALIAMYSPHLEWPRQWMKEIESDQSLVSARAGVAMTAINMWSNTQYRAMSTDALIGLLAFGEREVWVAVFDLFRIVQQLTTEIQTTKLLVAIAEHIESAPSIDGTFIVPSLNSLLPHNAEIIGRIANGLVKIWQGQLADPSTSIALSAYELINLATTLHRLGSATREQGLVLFEQLTEFDAYQARDVMDEIDNRFRGSANPVRPRLRRRSQIRAQARKKT